MRWLPKLGSLCPVTTSNSLVDLNARIYVAGHRGLVGAAITRQLEQAGATDLLLRTRAELDLTDQAAVESFFAAEQPAYVFLAAAHVGGIQSNDTYPAEFIRDNLVIQTNVIHAAWKTGVNRLLFLGSSCIYPRDCPQPMVEDYLLTGPLEATNEPYAVAKIAGIKMCQSYNRQYGTRYLSVMPTNLYGPFDNFDLDSSHVLPALLRKFHEARHGAVPREVVDVWGTGTPRREFLLSEEMADACIHLMTMTDDHFDGMLQEFSAPLVNIGCGIDIEIKELALLIQKIVGYEGDVRFDPTKPDGTPRKLLDVSRLKKTGWASTVSLEEGIRKTYDWCLETNTFGR
jgi:GDP-L-fucose synthase